jgi:prepilin-type N-terminal cleavage/methylation domain-containing protein
MKTTSPHFRKGFSLVEVILAVGILGVAILTLVALVGGSFLQVESVVQTNRALSVVTAVETALNNPEFIGGRKILDTSAQNKPRFDAIYKYVREAVNGKKLVLFYLTTSTINSQTRTSGASTLIYNATGDTLSRQKFTELNATGPVFRVEFSIAKQLEGLQVTFDPGKIRPTDELYSGGPLPPQATEYALAYIPLHLEVFPHQFGGANKERTSQPILAQDIIIHR